MKDHEGKCRVLSSTNENIAVNIGKAQIQNSTSKKLLGNNIDFKLKFKDHIGNICKKHQCQIKFIDLSLSLFESR